MTEDLKQLESLDYKPTKYDKCRFCGAGRVVRPAGEWQYACECWKKLPEQ